MNNENKKSENSEIFFGDDVFYSSPQNDDIQAELDKLHNAQPTKQPAPHSRVYRPKKSFLYNLFEWLDVVVASIVVVVIVFTFVFRIVAIDGASMNNTLFDGERVVITNMFYQPQRGDIVVISRNTENTYQVTKNNEPIIKRIIALEGDTVDIDFDNGIVYVNGEALKEDYIKEPTTRQGDVKFPLVVKENCIFVLGDNRNESLDSRSTDIGDNGLIDKKYILGHAVLRVLPFEKFGGIE